LELGAQSGRKNQPACLCFSVSVATSVAQTQLMLHAWRARPMLYHQISIALFHGRWKEQRVEWDSGCLQKLHRRRWMTVFATAWPVCSLECLDYVSRAPARGGHGGQAPTLEKIRVGMANPGNTNRGLKTFRQ